MHAPLGLPAGGRLCRQNPSRPEGFLPCDHTCNQWRCIVQWHLQQDSDGPMRCKPAVSRPAPASAAGPEWSLPAPSTEAVGGRRLLRDRHVIVRAAAEQLRRLVGLCATAHAEGEREEFDGRGGHTSAAAGGRRGSCAANERCTSCSWEHVAIARSCAGDAAADTSRSSAGDGAAAAARLHSCASARVRATAASGAREGLLCAALSSSWSVLYGRMHECGRCV